MQFEPLPELDDEAVKPADPPIHANHEDLEDELASAVQAAGPEEVARAVEQVATGEARPDALLEWIDDLRDFDKNQVDDAGAEQLGFVPEFIPDTMIAGGAVAQPGADDGDFVLSTARRRGLLDDDPDEEFGGGDDKPPPGAPQPGRRKPG